MSESMVNYNLICAVREGDIEEADKLISKYGLSHSQGWSQGYTLLLDAIRNEHEEMAKFLIKRGSRVNSNSQKKSDTPLHMASMNGYTDLVKILIDEYASVDARNKNHETPLHKAVDKKNVEVSLILLQHGAHVNARDHLGRTPLHLAVSNESYPIVEALLSDDRIDVNAKDRYNRIPLNFAVQRACSQINCKEFMLSSYLERSCAVSDSVQQKGSYEIVSLLLDKGADVNYQSDGVPPLHIAIERGCTTVVKELLKYGASVEAMPSSRGNTLLHLACQRGFKDIVALLLEKGLNINRAGENNSTPLSLAVKGGYESLVQMLIEQGASLDQKNNDLLFKSIEKGYLKIVEYFLQHGTCINLVYEGSSLIHRAVEYNQEDIVELLMSQKIDVNTLDGKGNTPLIYAVKNSNHKIIRALLLKGAMLEKNPKILEIAIEEGLASGVTAIIEELLVHGADANVQDDSGRTLLHTTIYNECRGKLSDGQYMDEDDFKAKIIEMLLEKGADANVCTSTTNKLTALHVASKKGYAKVVESLLRHKADVNAKTKGGYTAIQYAVKKGHVEVLEILLNSYCTNNVRQPEPMLLHAAAVEGDERIVETLLKFNADVNFQNEKGQTALFIASYNGHLDVVKCLLAHDCDINILTHNQNTSIHAVLFGIASYYENQYIDKYIDQNYRLDYGSYDDSYIDREMHNELIYERLIKTAKIIRKHIFMRELAGLYVSEHYSEKKFYGIDCNMYILKTFPKERFRDNCEKELARMKNLKMGISTDSSIYDILIGDTDLLSMRLLKSNRNVVQIFEPYDFKAIFSLYGDMINNKVKKILRRLKSVEEGIKSFCLHASDFDKMPSRLNEKIFNYLSDCDLKNLMMAVNAVR
ncbi:hypothetical protein QAD02_011545 [Eretmocerus hayati]|uniref:Uncharacterized protein n=1 Tax=Eretmocerus hayati TaxID=131215 RepID=A0ACC2NWV6_9HYME|nr:hypothetical protein QAD02_011545 [Eretmocerus hayati]